MASATQVATPPLPADEATVLFHQAIAAHDAGQLLVAEQLFLKAWAMKKTWDIAANLGLVELRLEKLPEAATHLYYAMIEVAPTESARTRERLWEEFSRVRREVAGFDLRCNEDGAEVRVNGKPAGKTPIHASVFVAVGQVTVEVEKDGFTSERRTFVMKRGSSQRVEVSLAKRESERARPSWVEKTPVTSAPRSQVASLVMGGVALVGVAVGVGMLAGSRAEYDRTKALGEEVRDSGGTCNAGAVEVDARCDDVASAGRASNALKVGWRHWIRCGGRCSGRSAVVLAVAVAEGTARGDAARAGGRRWDRGRCFHREVLRCARSSFAQRW
jgi:hypothetical protein